MSNELKLSKSKLSKLELALAEISNQVYLATSMIEDLESQQDLIGNGHHLRQELALRAQVLVFNHWKNEAEKEALSSTHPVKQYHAE